MTWVPFPASMEKGLQWVQEAPSPRVKWPRHEAKVKNVWHCVQLCTKTALPLQKWNNKT